MQYVALCTAAPASDKTPNPRTTEVVVPAGAVADPIKGTPANPTSQPITVTVPSTAPASKFPEVKYEGYKRVDAGPHDWNVQSVPNSYPNANANPINFPACTGGSATATHFAVIDTASGEGNIGVWGALASPLSIKADTVPTFPSGALSGANR